MATDKLPTARFNGQSVTSRILTFEGAKEVAEQKGWESYGEWRAGLERRYNVMPVWYWNETEAQQRYTQAIESKQSWEARQAGVTKSTEPFFDTLTKGVAE